MKAFGLGLATLFFALTAATASVAADKDALNAVGPLLQASNTSCTVTDARKVQEGQTDKGVTVKVYEVACQDSIGYILEAMGKGPPTVFDCLVADAPQGGKPSPVACKLPANANPATGLTPLVAKAGRTCSVNNARYIGSSPDASFYEVVCQEGSGYILQAPRDSTKTPEATLCLAMPTDGNVKCTLTTPEQQGAFITTLAAASGKNCTVKGQRYVGSTPDHVDFFEVACADGKGYMIGADAGGKFKQAVGCADASGFAGGCTLTDSRQAQTEQSGIYTDLAKKAGFDCQVSKYAVFPTAQGAPETVELACSNRPDGGVGVFPAQGKGIVYDCVRAAAEGFRCSYTPDSATYGVLTAQLRSRNRMSCTVSGARAYAKSAVEVACADGGPGYVIQYEASAIAPAALLNCVQAGQAGGGGCQLPTNKGGAKAN